MISDLQTEVITICLEASARYGFALAGSNALQSHGISTDRMSADADLFTDSPDPQGFAVALDAVISALEAAGFAVTTAKGDGLYAKLVAARTGQEVEIDLGSDWRAHAPATFSVGPVLAVEDAIGNKIAACFSRGEVRDFIDVAAIRATSGRTDAELFGLAAERDAGIDQEIFVRQLGRLARYVDDDFAEFGLDSGAVESLRESIDEFSRQVALLPRE